MNRFSWLMAGALAGVVLSTSAARADEMDLSLHRLKLDAEPGSEVCSPMGPEGNRTVCPDQNAWGRLMSQLGASMAPPVLAPANTVGYSGFELSFDTWATGIDSEEEYWARGTEGDQESAMEGRNRFVADSLFWSRLNIRKGFPAGFELSGSVGHAYRTSYWTWGVAVKWAIFEGFNRGAWKFVPDIAVRGMVQTMTGDGEFNLTVPSGDITISKPIQAFDVATFTPFASGQFMWVMADSELVDLTPGRDGLAECDPLPPKQAKMHNDRMRGNDNRSAVVCTGDPTDFNNNATFDKVRAMRYRLAFGLKFRYKVLTLKGSIAFDVKEPGDADAEEASFDDGGPILPRQWTVSFSAGYQM